MSVIGKNTLKQLWTWSLTINYQKGNTKQFVSAGDIQIWVDVCFLLFYPISLLHATQKLDIFSLLFVALSHCDKHNVGFWHQNTATNRIFVYCSESLWQPKLVYVTKKFQKTTENVLKKCKKRQKKVPKSAKKRSKVRKIWAL